MFLVFLAETTDFEGPSHPLADPSCRFPVHSDSSNSERKQRYIIFRMKYYLKYTYAMYSAILMFYHLKNLKIFPSQNYGVFNCYFKSFINFLHPDLLAPKPPPKNRSTRNLDLHSFTFHPDAQLVLRHIPVSHLNGRLAHRTLKHQKEPGFAKTKHRNFPKGKFQKKGGKKWGKKRDFLILKIQGKDGWIDESPARFMMQSNMGVLS